MGRFLIAMALMLSALSHGPVLAGTPSPGSPAALQVLSGLGDGWSSTASSGNAHNWTAEYWGPGGQRAVVSARVDTATVNGLEDVFEWYAKRVSVIELDRFEAAGMFPMCPGTRYTTASDELFMHSQVHLVLCPVNAATGFVLVYSSPGDSEAALLDILSRVLVPTLSSASKDSTERASNQ